MPFIKCDWQHFMNVYNVYNVPTNLCRRVQKELQCRVVGKSLILTKAYYENNYN